MSNSNNKNTPRRSLLPKSLKPSGKPEQGKPTFQWALKFVEALELDLGYDLLNQVEVMQAPTIPWSEEFGREVNDDVIRELRHLLVKRLDVTWKKDDLLEAVKTVAQKNRFHPVVKFLARLKWDGVPRLDQLFVKYAGATDSEYVRKVGAIFCIAAVRRARQPGTVFQTVPILEGPQGIKKSTFIAILGGEWFSDGELGPLDGKDAPIALQGVWIFELPELSAFNKAEQEVLKAFVSRAVDKYRAPYDKTSKRYPRSCVFMGTTNQGAYLSDLTGGRRYWPITATVIAEAELRRDINQIWAEAAFREAAGESIVLPEHLWGHAAEIQAERTAEDPWADKVRDYVTRQCLTRVHTNQLLEEAIGLPANQLTQSASKKLRTIMASLGGWMPKRSLRIKNRGVAAGYQHNEDVESDHPEVKTL